MRKYLLCAHENDTYKFAVRKPLVDFVASQGFEVHIAIPAGPLAEQVRSWGYTPHPLPLSRGSLNPLKERAALSAFKALHNQLRPDLTHNFTSKAVLYGSLAAKGTVISTITGIGFSLTGGMSGVKGKVFSALSRRLHKKAMARCALVTFQNQDDLDAFVGLGILPRSKTVLIQGSGIDMVQNHPSKRVPHDGPVKFVLLSRLIRPKGVIEFVEAARMVHEKAPGQAQFVMAGAIDAENPQRVTEDEVAAWQQEGAVSWIGTVPNAVEAFKDADVAVLPSYWLEGLPRSMVEAAAMGLPVITTSNSGCKDSVIDGETGIMIPPKDSNALAEAMLTLLASRELREQMGKAGRAFVEDRYSVESVVSQTWAVYERALGQKLA